MRNAFLPHIDDLDVNLRFSAVVTEDEADFPSSPDTVLENHQALPSGMSEDFAESHLPLTETPHSRRCRQKFRRPAGPQTRNHPYHRQCGDRGDSYGHCNNARNFAYAQRLGAPGIRFPAPSPPRSSHLVHGLQNEFRNVLYGCYPRQDPFQRSPRYFPEGDFVLPPTASMLTDMGLPLPDFNTQSDTCSNSDATTSIYDGEPTGYTLTGSTSDPAQAALETLEENGMAVVTASASDAELEELPLLYESFQDRDIHSDVGDFHSGGGRVDRTQDRRGRDAASERLQTFTTDVACASCGHPVAERPSPPNTSVFHQSLFERLDQLAISHDTICQQCSDKQRTVSTEQQPPQTLREMVTRIPVLSESPSVSENNLSCEQDAVHSVKQSELRGSADSSSEILTYSGPADVRTEQSLTTPNRPLCQSDPDACTVDDFSKGKCLERQFSSEVSVVTRRMGEIGL
ncbi:hypothetical protein BaRGS_00026683 [Batillaria attramentaria]|uniref:Uncharacterized protein n=1 Tax=Batillaria attramentaria TaxID=370345 RepID=A0ABD0K4T9_9CAEN